MWRALPEWSTILGHMFSKQMSNKGQARVLSHTNTHPDVRLRVRAARGYRRAQLCSVQRGGVHRGDGRRGVAPVVVCEETAACLHMLFHRLLSREVDKRLYMINMIVASASRFATADIQTCSAAWRRALLQLWLMCPAAIRL